MWPSRSPPRAHWRTIRSHTDIWDPDHPVQTIRDAITWASGLSEVDAERIGM
jgi:hypothetical protein